MGIGCPIFILNLLLSLYRDEGFELVINIFINDVNRVQPRYSHISMVYCQGQDDLVLLIFRIPLDTILVCLTFTSGLSFQAFLNIDAENNFFHIAGRQTVFLNLFHNHVFEFFCLDYTEVVENSVFEILKWQNYGSIFNSTFTVTSK